MIARILLLLVRAYQATFSRLLPPGVCIYSPSCSQFMAEALQTHGALKGILLGTLRICRCHPFARGGYDPVPLKGQWRSSPEDQDVDSTANEQDMNRG